MVLQETCTRLPEEIRLQRRREGLEIGAAVGGNERLDDLDGNKSISSCSAAAASSPCMHSLGTEIQLRYR
jgi:hypothetical protein